MVKIITTSHRTQKCRHECQSLKTERWEGYLKSRRWSDEKSAVQACPPECKTWNPWRKENPSPKVVLWCSDILHTSTSPYECTCLNTHIHTQVVLVKENNLQKESNFWKNAFRFLNLYFMNNCHFFLVHEQTLCSFYIF